MKFRRSSNRAHILPSPSNSALQHTNSPCPPPSHTCYHNSLRRAFHTSYVHRSQDMASHSESLSLEDWLPWAIFVLDGNIDTDVVTKLLERAMGPNMTTTPFYLMYSRYYEHMPQLDESKPREFRVGHRLPLMLFPSGGNPFAGKTPLDCSLWLRRAPASIALNRRYFLCLDGEMAQKKTFLLCREGWGDPAGLYDEEDVSMTESEASRLDLEDEMDEDYVPGMEDSMDESSDAWEDLNMADDEASSDEDDQSMTEAGGDEESDDESMTEAGDDGDNDHESTTIKAEEDEESTTMEAKDYESTTIKAEDDELIAIKAEDNESMKIKAEGDNGDTPNDERLLEARQSNDGDLVSGNSMHFATEPTDVDLSGYFPSTDDDSGNDDDPFSDDEPRDENTVSYVSRGTSTHDLLSWRNATRDVTPSDSETLCASDSTDTLVGDESLYQATKTPGGSACSHTLESHTEPGSRGSSARNSTTCKNEHASTSEKEFECKDEEDDSIAVGESAFEWLRRRDKAKGEGAYGRLDCRLISAKHLFGFFGGPKHNYFDAVPFKSYYHAYADMDMTLEWDDPFGSA
ncbi:hypothetical protein BDY21DRAFT_382019 [Lineolata rhizophorae]|uniref:Uncharacterized protein n=1 Tax=Lineolata rhizophorae TaxID=578093 RepID=A0A6A6NQB0_9PEZI|nr:hypothetical protein BDY21DRAFT_382019 [Lineolata rhizophorae]